MEIWNFCYSYKPVLNISMFTLQELNSALLSVNDDESYLVTCMIQSMVDAYVKDVRELSEKELYSTFAILVLEFAEQLFASPIEAAALIFKVMTRIDELYL